MHKSALRSFDSEGSACKIRIWFGKTSEDGQAESEHGSMEASEELDFRSRSTEVLMVSRSEALQGQKTRICSAPSCIDSEDSNVVSTKDQSELIARWQAMLTDKRNVRSY